VSSLGLNGDGISLRSSGDSETEIFDDQLDHEASVIVITGGSSFLVPGNRGVSVNGEASSGRYGNDITEDSGVSSHLLSHGQGLGDSNHVNTKDKVVGQLSNESLSSLSAVEYVLSHTLEDGSSSFDMVGITSAHE